MYKILLLVVSRVWVDFKNNEVDVETNQPLNNLNLTYQFNIPTQLLRYTDSFWENSWSHCLTKDSRLTSFIIKVLTKCKHDQTLAEESCVNEQSAMVLLEAHLGGLLVFDMGCNQF